MTEPMQLTVTGAQEPLQAPETRNEVQHLFTAPQTIRGQLAMTEKEERRERTEAK